MCTAMPAPPCLPRLLHPAQTARLPCPALIPLVHRHDATALATPQAFTRDPALVWSFYHWRREVVAAARPNAAHAALAAYEQRAAAAGQDFTLVTQNIDRLHQAAGSRGVIEMHGSLWDLCVAGPGGIRSRCRPPWEDRRQPLVPALAGAGHPDGPAESISGARWWQRLAAGEGGRGWTWRGLAQKVKRAEGQGGRRMQGGGRR